MLRGSLFVPDFRWRVFPVKASENKRRYDTSVVGFLQGAYIRAEEFVSPMAESRFD
jgi:hypothetical protein